MARYTTEQKQEILEFARNHTYQATTEKYGVSEMSIARWKKEIPSENDGSDEIYKQASKQLL